MDRDRRFESVFSKKMNAGKRRTYFFDVRQTKGDDFYLTLTESTKRFNGDGFERHKIFLYKEDFNRFVNNLEEVINYIKTELMPDYDYEEFDRLHEEWDAQDEANGYERSPRSSRENSNVDDEIEEDGNQWKKPSQSADSPPPSSHNVKFDDDLSW
ncbi:MAG: DUF3276 family protein [Bacteroidetes bacterium]|nr:DUF3276 family protein [Bacteroidota bacterium]